MIKQIYFSLLLLLFTSLLFAQEEGKQRPSLIKTDEQKKAELAQIATIDQYRIISLERDTTFVDTSLTIQKDYKFNYLRKDIFGLQPFSNEGQTYNTLQYSLNSVAPFPEFGYKAKHFNYMEADQIKYYSVATPFTDLYFKSVMGQGQNLDAFITLNTSERFNFSLAYKGLRSQGKYINQLSSTGNFRFTASYNTLNTRYYANAHFTAQDMLNGENGGITNNADFESEDDAFKNRARINVFFKDAKSILKGKRAFLDHNFRINPTPGANNLYLTHQLNFESKYFEFNQATLFSTLDDNSRVQRFGDAYVTQNINDQVRYNRMYNKVGAVYENTTLGKFSFFADDFRYNYYYGSILVIDNQPIPSALNDRINSISGQYEYQNNNWHGKFILSNSISDQSMSNLEANLQYAINDKNTVSFQYQNINKLPNHIYVLHQSSYVNYNWYNDFKNEKSNIIKAEANTQWVNASLQIATYTDQLYFSNDATSLQLVSPKQYDKTINYLSVKASREFKFRKFALDNTLLYQKVDQQDNILNVPQIVTRNTLYFSDQLFKKALYLQTGITLNYFTNYYANDYNPIIGEFFVQNEKEIGNFPMLDFFINARIKQTRIFFKAEHFNSAMTGNTFYSAPNAPYRDFTIRFGLVWNFFQ